ncbi:hypothetical protein [Chitinophaga rhizophila]|uniref:Uncharacterized protein n=1 Tax=Chitinophaga rhizophila TaxID=2866212 RepID=A0ABS7GHT2_9BACT|nr:hypothetical protein [Chitinophaga rhizophila]MBW8687243.1 hypothetical protein [Chitinophaga rhizophila]
MLNYIEIAFRHYDKLQEEANSVALSYLSLIGKAKFIKNRRIDIDIINSKEEIFQIDGHKMSKVEITVGCDVDEYLQKPWEIRRKILYEIVFYSMDSLGKENNWDLDFLNEVKNEILDSKYIIFTPYSKPIKKNGLTAQLVVSHDVGLSDFKLVIYNKGMSIIKTIEFFKAFENLTFVSYYFSKCYWVDFNTFRIADRNDEIFFDISVLDGSTRISFDPKKNSAEALEKYILALRYETPMGLRKQYMQA